MINVNMTDKAGVTLATAGKYCADNVKVTPSADILRKDEQAKTATPTTSVQDITPDAGKALSKVTVNPITAAIVGNLDASSFASAIVSAIEGKGVIVPDGAKLDALAALVESIQAGGGATKPYIEETYNSQGNLTAAVMHGTPNIRPYAFCNCSSLSSVTIPDSVTSIGSSAFYKCRSLVSVTIPDSVTSIKGHAFYECNYLSSVTIGNSVTSIESYAFYECNYLSSVTIPDSVTSIGMSAFYGCSGLSSVTIPDSVTSIGNSAFSNCRNLTSVTFNGTPSSIYNNAFYSCSKLTTINVPWAEGEVANAPWGATKATINYNYTGG